MLLETGAIPSAEKLKAKIPVGLVEITNIPGLGPKRVRLLHEALGITGFDDLRKAAEEGRLKDVAGFGPKAEENVLAALAAGPEAIARPRALLSKALLVGEALVEGLREHPVRAEGGAGRQRAPAGPTPARTSTSWRSTSDPAALVVGVRRAGGSGGGHELERRGRPGA